ncbi:hypothetical protein HMI55_000520 [Coelomomyces lativittatus]|nr:hypothetical protein HMI55_000520 [Coelomomyces lativittatus]
MKKLMKRFSTIETNLVSVNSNLLKMKNFLEAMANFLKDTRVDEQTSNFKFNRNPKAFEPQKKHLILQAMEPFSKEKANMEKDGWKEILETENNFKPNTQEGTLRRRKRI